MKSDEAGVRVSGPTKLRYRPGYIRLHEIGVFEYGSGRNV
jgi:hypothetical protein